MMKTLLTPVIAAACLVVAQRYGNPGARLLHAAAPPALRAVAYPLDRLGPAGPATATSLVAVARNGTIAFSEPRDSAGRPIRVVDSTGRTIADVGATAGANRLGRLGMLFLTDSGLAAYSNATIYSFGFDGALRARQRLGPTRAPLAVHEDSMDIVDVNDFVQGKGPIVVSRARMGEAAERRIVSASNAAYRALVSWPGDSTRFVLPAYATDGPTIVIGNGVTYRLGRFSPAGDLRGQFGRTLGLRRLSPEERANAVDSAARAGVLGPDGARHRAPADKARLDSLLDAPKEYFTGRAQTLALDDAKRTWVLGTTSTGAFVDVFSSAGTFLGRADVPCRPTARGMAVAPPWVAAVCHSGQTRAPGSFPQLRLFRITGISNRRPGQ